MSKIKPFENVIILQRNVWQFWTLPDSCPAGHTFLCKILTFLNGCILLTIGSSYTKLGDFVNLGVLFQTMGINSCLSHNLQTLTQSFMVWNQVMSRDNRCALHATSSPGVPFVMRWKDRDPWPGPTTFRFWMALCKHNRLRPEPIRFARRDSEHAQSDGKSVNRRPGQRSRSPLLFKRIVASGNEIALLFQAERTYAHVLN